MLEGASGSGRSAVVCHCSSKGGVGQSDSGQSKNERNELIERLLPREKTD
jgi:hypothetical protein